MIHRRQRCYVWMNCVGKSLKTYLDDIAEFDYDIKYFYCLDSLAKVDVPFLETVDLFLYQYINTSVYNNRGAPEIDVAEFSTEHIKRRLKRSCKTVSFPSPYYSGYFPEGTTKEDIPPSFQDRRDLFPNFCFNKRLMSLLKQGKRTAEIMAVLTDPEMYSKKDIKVGGMMSLDKLQERERYNRVDVPLTKFIKDNQTKRRLFHSTNHPTVVVFEYFIAELFRILHIVRAPVVLERDLMVKVSRPPILPCVAACLGLTDPSFGAPYYSFGEKFDSLEAYVAYYVGLFTPSNDGRGDSATED